MFQYVDIGESSVKNDIIETGVFTTLSMIMNGYMINPDAACFAATALANASYNL